jgi:hypothetical protein
MKSGTTGLAGSGRAFSFFLGLLMVVVSAAAQQPATTAQPARSIAPPEVPAAQPIPQAATSASGTKTPDIAIRRGQLQWGDCVEVIAGPCQSTQAREARDTNQSPTLIDACLVHWRLAHARIIYGKKVFMQKQLPPDFSNSEVSTITGVSPS